MIDGKKQQQKIKEASFLETPLVTYESTLHEVDGGILLQNNNNKRKAIIDELKQQLWLAGPLISVNLLLYSLQLISLMFVGHLGDIPLAGASMATSFAAVTGFSFLIGMTGALDTFCGQSYGAKQYSKLGIHMQRAMIVNTLTSIPLAFIWYNTQPILTFLGQDPAIAAEAGQYARYLIPCIFAYGLLHSLLRFLQTQNNVMPMVLTSAVTAVLQLGMCWLFVVRLGFGSRGAAIANVVSYWVNVVVLGLYVACSVKCKETWTGFGLEGCRDLTGFLKLAIPSAVMTCLEMWSFEMMVLMAGLLPNPALETSVLSICLNTAATVWMIPFGLSGAVSTRVSNELGAGNPAAARLAVFVVIGLAVTEGLLTGIILILIRRFWGYAYSNEPRVAEYVAAMIPILAVSNFMDGIQAVLSGIARGCGWQQIGAYINLGSYYLLGLPSAILLAFFFHFGGRGLWTGIILALGLQAILLMVITFRTNWDKEAGKAADRVYESIIPVTAPPASLS